MESNVNNSPAGKDIRCADCRKSYRNCDCKSCSKCGCSYRKYAGTSLVKGRSHCRSCRSAVCLTCYVLVQGKKICTRCHLRQKEDEMNTEKALIAIEEAKYGKSDDQSLYSRLMHGERRETILFEAAKNGDDHVLVIALNMGADVNVTDSNKNTPLFHAAEGGRLACCALLLDRKADVNTVNNSGWTPLHAVAWKGSSDNHVECADLLLEAGADALAETSTNETAADVAERCGGKKEIIEILRAAEVEVTVLRLREKIKSLQGLNAKDRKLWRMITCLLNYTCKIQQNEIETVTGDIKNKRLALPCEPLLRCSSLDRDFGKKVLCEKCGGSTMLSPKKQPFNDMSRPTADVEPMVRSMSLLHEVDGERSAVDTLDSASLRDRLVKLEAEKKDWEQRCRKLMQSVATNSKEHLRAMDLAKEEILRLKEEKEVELRKCEAAYANKLAKVRQEADTTIWEYHKQLEEAELVKDELTHLQKFHKLTWVPDYFVKSCQNPKCRSPFTQTNRKHHCRCCGRVYCHSCSSRKLTITSLGYDSPVRVCSSCFALVEDFFIDAEDAKIKLEANPVK